MLAPVFGIATGQDLGTDVRFGFVPRYYFHKEKLSPYIGARFALLMYTPQSGSSTTDFLTGVAFGGEYFLGDHFSFGVESQLNAAKSGDTSTRFGNPGKWTVNTAAALSATVYF